MMDRKTGGHSYAEPEFIEGKKKVRLFPTIVGARNAIIAWKRGIHTARVTYYETFDGHDMDSCTVVEKVPSRDSIQLEVVPVYLSISTECVWRG